MPVRNYFPVFHKLRSGAYSYVWTDKCERLLPKHYKASCLEYMEREPEPVHWKPDTRKYTYDKYDKLMPVQNHPVRVKYPVQCNSGLWAGEGVIQCYVRNVRSKKFADMMTHRVAKYYVPFLVERALYSEILDKWFKIPCTNRAMDQIDEKFGLDFYILQTHERDLNSKLAMDLRRKMLIQLCDDSDAFQSKKLDEKREAVFNRYKDLMIPRHKAEWVGLSITEALEKAEGMGKQRPLKHLIKRQYLKSLEGYVKEENSKEGEEETKQAVQSTEVSKESKGFFSFFSGGKSAQEKR